MGDSMKKIIRIEDITEIVGIKNYIEALSLDQEKLIYLGYDKKNSEIVFNFKYEDHTINIMIDKKNNINKTICNCQNDGEKNCKHIAICLIYLMSNNLVTEAIENLNHDYDAEFNHLLFEKLIPKKVTKIPLKLEITLKGLDYDEYELQIKIGETKTYTLKRCIKEFYEVYNSKNGDVEFGKNFIYNPKIHYFNDVDAKIIEFLNIYMDSQIPRYGYYSYYENISMIKLTNKSLKSFLKLLKNKKFRVEYNNLVYIFDGILDGNVDISIKELSDGIKVDLNLLDQIPFISDYSYIISNNNLYYLNKQERKLLKIITENRKKELIFKNEELGAFSNYVYPVLNKLDQNIKMEDKLKEKFIIEPLKVKYYFDYDKNRLFCMIKMNYNNYSLNIIDNTNNFNGVYITRDKEEETKYISELSKYGFSLDIKKKYYYLENDRIIEFLEKGLNEISSKYETYISKKVKNTKVIKKANITNTFKIGKDNVLTYNFNIENIDKQEITNVLNSYREKKKYYHLKNGDYISLDSEEFDNLDSLFNNLNIKNKDLEKDQIEIPIYKSLYINDMLDEKNNFIQVNNNFDKLIKNYEKYRSSNINLSNEDLKILRDYQITGIKWMNIISKCGFGGILADEMGLGKSIQTIKFISQNRGKTLIVVPTSLIYNWENEFNKFGQDLKYLIINGNQIERYELLEKINDYDVLITTYGLLRNDIEKYLEYEFDNFIIDEAQNIKNAFSQTTEAVKKIKAKTKFALTGTPIENSILELWSIFDFIMPGFLLPLNRFKKEYKINNIDDDTSMDRLNKLITPFILRRKKKDVLKDLPDKIENNIIVELNDEQKKLYLMQLEKTKEELDKLIKDGNVNKSSILILSLLTKLRQICIDPRLLFENEIKSSKLDTLIEILNEVKKEHKILLFSQYPSALKLIIPTLDENNITYYYLDGSTKSNKRVELVNKFNKDDTNIFLISLKAGGTGLNLTSADVVIHLDPWWNPQVENQATDRSHRIGQKKVVEVIKLIAKGTIEEKIVELQNKKQKLSDKIIEGDNRDSINISKMDVENLKELIGI